MSSVYVFYYAPDSINAIVSRLERLDDRGIVVVPSRCKRIYLLRDVWTRAVSYRAFYSVGF